MLPVDVDQRGQTVVAGVDYLTDFASWRAVENGGITGANRYEKETYYLRNGRDLAQYVHRDVGYQAFLGACLAALRWGAPEDGGNPYKHSRTQSAFGTFGAPYMLYLLAAVTEVGLKAAWFQKWRVHRRLRPEEFGGRVHGHVPASPTTHCTPRSWPPPPSSPSASAGARLSCPRPTPRAARRTPPTRRRTR